jgi:hypothetical protein
VPSAKKPTRADPRMPVPYWLAPMSADMAPERAGTAPSAPAIGVSGQCVPERFPVAAPHGQGFG